MKNYWVSPKTEFKLHTVPEWAKLKVGSIFIGAD